MRKFSWRTAVVLWWAIAFAAGIAILASMRHRDAVEIGAQMDKIIAADERLAAAVAGSLAQARRGLDDSREICRADRRARLGIARVDFRGVHAGQKIEVNMPIQNSGKTAALDVRIRSLAYVAPVATNAAKPSPNGHEPFKGHITILPNTTNAIITLVSPRTLSEDEASAIQNGALIMYIFAEIRYEDIFGHPHHTYFCAKYATDTPRALQYCDEYNGAD